ncbi:MAG TPA: DUF433 domain-containing protein [Dehalococcoidia bacterium]|nr:DUF433 domain-containing protein [Dehalococcoidia bacterium]
MTSKTPTKLKDLLVTRPGYRQGRPCLRGTGLTVHAVAAAYLMGLSAEEICQQNPDLDRSLFYAALAYYFANRAEIEADLERDRVEGNRLAAQYPDGITPATFRP